MEESPYGTLACDTAESLQRTISKSVTKSWTVTRSTLSLLFLTRRTNSLFSHVIIALASSSMSQRAAPELRSASSAHFPKIRWFDVLSHQTPSGSFLAVKMVSHAYGTQPWRRWSPASPLSAACLISLATVNGIPDTTCSLCPVSANTSQCSFTSTSARRKSLTGYFCQEPVYRWAPIALLSGRKHENVRWPSASMQRSPQAYVAVEVTRQ